MTAILVAAAVGLLLALLGTPLLIRFLHRREYGQFIRQDGPQGHFTKRGTPTMGGLVIILATVLGYGAANLIELRTPTPQTQAPTAGAETPAKDSADKLPAKPGAGESKHLVGRGKMPIKPGGTGTALPPKSAKTQGGKARSGAKVSPAVRRLARSLGVDLKTVTGTGAGGAITPEDVQTAADHAAGDAS